MRFRKAKELMLDRPFWWSGIIVLAMVAVVLAVLAGKAAWYVQSIGLSGVYSPNGPEWGIGNVFGSTMHTADEDYRAEAIEAGSKQAWKYIAGSLFAALVAMGTAWFATSMKSTTNRNPRSSQLILGASVLLATASLCFCFAFNKWTLIRDSRDNSSNVRRKWNDSESWGLRIPSEKNGCLVELVCKKHGETYRSRAIVAGRRKSLKLFMIRNPANHTIKYGWYQFSFSSAYDSEYPYGPKMIVGKSSEVALGEMEDPFPAGSVIAERDRRFGLSDGDVLMQYRDGETEYIPTLPSAYEIRVILRPPPHRQN